MGKTVHYPSDFHVRSHKMTDADRYLFEQVYIVLCEQGDLISVPANIAHRFDMGRHPYFRCIRLFVIPDGWVAQLIDSNIARCLPDFDQFVSNT